MAPAHLLGRKVAGYIDEEGCGFVGVEFRFVDWTLLGVSIYFKSGIGITADPNPILGYLFPHLRPFNNWLILGDWNFPAEDLASTTLCSQIGGAIVSSGQPTIDTGNELDYAVASRSLCSLLTPSLDWAVPFRPHAAVRFVLDVPAGALPFPQLQGFTGQILTEALDVEARPVTLGHIGSTPLHDDSATLEFAAFTQQMADCHYGAAGGRGTNNPTVYRPLLQPPKKCPWFGAEAAWWQGLLQAWEHKPPRFPKIIHLLNQAPLAAIERVAREFNDCGIEASSPYLTLVEWTETALTPGRLHTLQRLCMGAISESKEEESKSYMQWLTNGSQKGMRPLFRALKKPETVLSRPFGDSPAETRPFLRLKQWASLWQAKGSPLAPPAGLKHRATHQAQGRRSLTGRDFKKVIKALPNRAPGLDGWTVDLLKSLSRSELDRLADVWRAIELTGDLPHQVTFTAFTMLPKSQTIERPIGLMSTFLKLGIKCRWHLISDWLHRYEDELWWTPPSQVEAPTTLLCAGVFPMRQPSLMAHTDARCSLT